ncbi:MAG: UDP-N-acetylmuramoylalanine-D-glutamate ligase, partial [Zhongshania aliphaticivorans]
MLEKLDPPIHKKAEKYSRVAVFGAGLSGRSARSLAIKLGLDVCLFDEGGQGDASEFHDELLGEFDAFIFSPGFAAKHPWRVLV